MATKGSIRSTAPRSKNKVRSTVLQDLDTIEAVCLAKIGKGNQLLRTRYNINLSDGQLTYRLTKAKTLAGLDKGDGFRKQWREGRSDVEEIVAAVMPELRKEYRREILVKVEKATPQVAPGTA